MSHPLVVTLDRKSAPRTIFSGDRLIEVDLPPGTRCIYPKQPIAPLKDVEAAIRYAINHPQGSDPLHAKLRPGMKVVIGIDDISLPLPPMRRPDIRERVLTVVLQTLADHGVNVDMIVQDVSHDGTTDISFTTPSGDAQTAADVASALAADIGAGSVAVDDHIGRVSLIGAGMKTHPGVAATMFETLAANSINIEMISTSAIRISCVVRQDQVENAVVKLHEAFKLDVA